MAFDLAVRGQVPDCQNGGGEDICDHLVTHIRPVARFAVLADIFRWCRLGWNTDRGRQLGQMTDRPTRHSIA